ncbi:hypothetical protein [Aeromonas taiwanensis]
MKDFSERPTDYRIRQYETGQICALLLNVHLKAEHWVSPSEFYYNRPAPVVVEQSDEDIASLAATIPGVERTYVNTDS